MTPESVFEVSQFVKMHYFEAVIARPKSITLTAGELQKQMGWGGRIAEICEILSSNDFQLRTDLELIEQIGPANHINTQFRYKPFEGYPKANGISG